jgi:hypothetical protein
MSYSSPTCEQCGGPLPPAAPGAWVRCPYCGRQAQAPKPGQANPLGHTHPAQAQPPPAVQPNPSGPVPMPPYGAVAPPRPASRAPLLFAVAAMGVLGVMGAVVFMLVARVEPNRATPHPPGALAPPAVAPAQPSDGTLPPGTVVPAPPHAPSSAVPGAAVAPSPADRRVEGRLCMVGDRNGDGVRELAALVYRGRADPLLTPVVFDGTTGAVRWEGREFDTGGRDTYLLCAGASWLGIHDDGTFQLRLIPLDAPDREVRHVLSDEVFYWGATDDCIRFRTDDRQRTSFSLAHDGEERACSAPLDRRLHIPFSGERGIISTLRRGHRVQGEGGVEFRLRGRRPGTAFLIASAHRRGRALWEIPLRFVPVDGEAIGTLAAVAAPDTMILFGQPRDQDIFSAPLHIVGLDAESGAERFATPTNTRRLGEFYYNGRYVVFGTDDTILAVDPGTGQIAWRPEGLAP